MNNKEDIQKKIRDNFPEIASTLWKAYKHGEIDRDSLNKFLEDEDIKSAIREGVTIASIIGGAEFFSKHPNIFKILKSLAIGTGAIASTWFLSRTEDEIKEKEIEKGNIESIWFNNKEKEKLKIEKEREEEKKREIYEKERRKCQNCYYSQELNGNESFNNRFKRQCNYLKIELDDWSDKGNYCVYFKDINR